MLVCVKRKMRIYVCLYLSRVEKIKYGAVEIYCFIRLNITLWLKSDTALSQDVMPMFVISKPAAKIPRHVWIAHSQIVRGR